MASLYIVVQHFASGGAERVASILIDNLSSKGHEIFVETDITKPRNYSIPDSVKIIPTINPKTNCCSAFTKIKRILSRRNHIKTLNPDVIISFLPTAFFESRIATLGLHKKHIASDHTSMNRNLGRRVNFLRRKFYRYADVVTLLTQKDKKISAGYLHNTTVIHNPLTFSPAISVEHKQNTILCVGRIEPTMVKGFDRMVQLWAKLSPKYPGWMLRIVGGGDKESIGYIKTLIERYGLTCNTQLVGEVKNIIHEYQKAAIFALPSRVEGFPMVLTEAMSQGCSCISFSLEGAANEIFGEENSGIIVEDDNLSMFEKKLSWLLDNEKERIVLSATAIKRSHHFCTSSFISKWERIISELLK